MKITSLLLVLIVAVGAIGINILSYCCSHKEVSIFASIGCVHEDGMHTHHSHAEAHFHTTSSCCSQQQQDDCCPQQQCNCTKKMAKGESHHHSDDHCTKNDFVQLKPVKISDYVVSFMAPLPVIIELFDFNPAVTITSDLPPMANDLPPNDSGREILAKNAILLI